MAYEDRLSGLQGRGGKATQTDQTNFLNPSSSNPPNSPESVRSVARSSWSTAARISSLLVLFRMRTGEVALESRLDELADDRSVRAEGKT